MKAVERLNAEIAAAIAKLNEIHPYAMVEFEPDGSMTAERLRAGKRLASFEGTSSSIWTEVSCEIYRVDGELYMYERESYRSIGMQHTPDPKIRIYKQKKEEPK